MISDRKPANRSRFAEPELVPPNSDPASTLALMRAIRDTRRLHRTHHAGVETLGIILFAPALVVIAAVITLALLGYFVAWLCFVTVLFASTVIKDMAHRGWRRVGPLGAARALSYPPPS
jgi:hypothetical protein